MYSPGINKRRKAQSANKRYVDGCDHGRIAFAYPHFYSI